MKNNSYFLILWIAVVILGLINSKLPAQDYALDFNGSVNSRYVYCENLFVSGSAPRTVEAWVNPRTFATTNVGVFECGHGASGSGLINFGLRTGNANEWKVELHDETLIYNSTGTLNNWTHFALVYDGTNVKLYHNGNLVIDVARGINTIQSSFLIGRFASGFFDGKIDEVRFWNVARTQGQIQASMYSELSLPQTGLIGYYKMNEGSGTTTQNAVTLANNEIRYSQFWVSGFTSSFVLPTVTTQAVTSVTATTAVGNGNVTDLGYLNPFQYGVCWNTSGNPTITDSKTQEGTKSATGSFTSSMTVLIPCTTYYVRAYATNSAGTSYGDQVSFTTNAFSGTGTSGDPYLVFKLSQLQYISENNGVWSKYFKQTSNIDASATISWNSNQGFSPIGNGTYNFTGSYDGQGFTIDGLYISRSGNDNQGLFGYVDEAIICNVHLTNVNITGHENVGALVGISRFSSQIKNCNSTGNVSGYNSVGGLVGTNESSTISTSWSTCSMNGTNWSVGGLCGYNLESSAHINNCYSRGTISGVNGVGGFVGNNTIGNIDSCYSTGSVMGSNLYTGGLVGYNNGNISNSFWDKLTSTKTTSNGGTGKTTAEMQSVSTFTSAGWSFYGINGGTIWNIGNDRNNGYPYLQWQYPADSPLPVELSSFTAEAKNNKVTLNWKTESEVNNYGFEIERCKTTDVRNQTWEKIGFVPGSGNSNSQKAYSFTDKIACYDTILYRLKQIDNDGQIKYSESVSVLLKPTEFGISQNYPNPFNPVTTIKFTIPASLNPSQGGTLISLKVYDVLGNEVITLVNEERPAGEYEVKINGSNLASGIYFYRLQAGPFSEVRKMILMK